jgi:hypothetical protein
MANIFYEIGMAKLLGKSVYLITNYVEAIPSDVVGDRHILYNPANVAKFRSEILRITENIEDKSQDFADRASFIIEQENVNFELAFEFIRLAILLSDNTFAKTLLSQLTDKISSRKYNGLPGGMRDYHDKVRALIRSFKRHVSGPLYNPSRYAGAAARIGGVVLSEPGVGTSTPGH